MTDSTMTVRSTPMTRLDRMTALGSWTPSSREVVLICMASDKTTTASNAGYEDTLELALLVRELLQRLRNMTSDGGTLLCNNYISDCTVGREGRHLSFEGCSQHFYSRPELLVLGPPAATKSYLHTGFQELPSYHLVDHESPHLEALQWIKEATQLPWERIAALLGVSRQTLYLWQQGKPITDANRRQILAVRDILHRATLLFPAPEQLSAWLDTPRGVDASTPAELLGAGELDKARFLAVTKPSFAV